MEPEVQPAVPATQPDAGSRLESSPTHEGLLEPDLIERIFLGTDGLRSGWCIAIFALLSRFLPLLFGSFLFLAHLIEPEPAFTAQDTLFRELAVVLGMLTAAGVAMLLEQRSRSLLDFNLRGTRRGRHFFTGLLTGFLSIAALVIALQTCGWLTLAPSGLGTGQILKATILWGIAFLLVGIYEEGTFRCYLQAMFMRSLNLWWALGIQTVVVAYLQWQTKGNAAWGAYIMILLGLGPCVWLVLNKAESSNFWLAAWVASTLFGAIHTGNGGENWIGIFAAAAIGFVFAVSVKLTGSAWWAIGFHAAWDWAETFFFGTADSGMQAHGSLMIAKPLGNAFWSGGANGPEGSILVLAVILLTLVGIVLAYGRREKCQVPDSSF